MMARYHIADAPDGHGFLACQGHALLFLDRDNFEGCWVNTLGTDRPGECLKCAAADAEIIRLREKTEYDALSDYQKGAYDYCGQGGGDHRECMEAAESL